MRQIGNMLYTSHPISTSGKINYWGGQEQQKLEDLLWQNFRFSLLECLLKKPLQSQRYDSCYSKSYLQNQEWKEVVWKRIYIGKKKNKKKLYISGIELTVGIWFIGLWLPLRAAAMPLLQISGKNTVTKRQRKPDGCMKLNRLMISYSFPLYLLS